MRLKQIIYLCLILGLFTSCGITSKRSYSSGNKSEKVLKAAHSYLGTKYKYGGESRRGMDCSGLVLKSFEAINLQVPRVSREQAKYGTTINLKNVRSGDLLFFKTSGRKISHVGIVDHIKRGEVFFIHASSSKGVTVSSLNNKYWNKRFVKAVRYLR